MGFWFLLFYLDAGVPVNVALYTYDEQRCLTIASEHLEQQQMKANSYIEVIYIGCPQGSAPRH